METQTFLTYLVPALITALLLAVSVQIKRSLDMKTLRHEKHYLRMRLSRDEAAEEAPKPIKELLKRDDATLRLLEEVHETSSYRYMRGTWSGSADAVRLSHLEGIEAELKNFLRESVTSDEFAPIRDRVLQLLDELRGEKQRLSQKEPFNDIRDPEKSLLIDIFNDLPPGNAIVRQKAVQLSNIIKIKHQDIAKLQEENSRAATWTRWGTAGTIFFGLLSLVLSLAPLWSGADAP